MGKSHSRCCEVDSEILGTPFATICHYSRLFAIIRTIPDYSDYLCYSLVAIRDYSLFAICHYSLFAILVFQTPILLSLIEISLDLDNKFFEREANLVS